MDLVWQTPMLGPSAHVEKTCKFRMWTEEVQFGPDLSEVVPELHRREIHYGKDLAVRC